MDESRGAKNGRASVLLQGELAMAGDPWQPQGPTRVVEEEISGLMLRSIALTSVEREDIGASECLYMPL